MHWKVKYIDYPAYYESMRGEILATIDETLTRGDVMLRQQLRDFERNLADFVGTKHAVGVSNCTDAMYQLLRAAAIGPGDEITPISHTIATTAAAIGRARATPVPNDVGDDHA